MSPSMSVSLVRTPDIALISMESFSLTDLESSLPLGALLVPVTVMVSSPRSLSVPSFKVYVNTSTAVAPSARASAAAWFAL